MENNEEILTSKNFKFLPYNTGLPRLAIPEYGRNIQNMVDYCVEIPDKEERTVCAYGIIGVMRTLFPSYVGEGGDLKKFWDHLNIMARFELDIDFPCEVVTADTANPKPNPIPYGKGGLKFRHYGRSLENIIKIVADMEEGEEKTRLISMIAHQMKKLMLTHNPEGVDNAKILRDLRDYSDGKINLDPNKYILHDFQDITPQPKKKKGKRKKK